MDKGTPGIAFLQSARRLLVRKKLWIAKELLKQSTSIPVQGRPEFFFQPLRATAQTLLAPQPLAC